MSAESSSRGRRFGEQLSRLEEPESVVEPDIDPIPNERKGKGRATNTDTGITNDSSKTGEKKHSPFIGFAAGVCSGWVSGYRPADEGTRLTYN